MERKREGSGVQILPLKQIRHKWEVKTIILRFQICLLKSKGKLVRLNSASSIPTECIEENKISHQMVLRVAWSGCDWQLRLTFTTCSVRLNTAWFRKECKLFIYPFQTFFIVFVSKVDSDRLANLSHQETVETTGTDRTLSIPSHLWHVKLKIVTLLK